MRVSPSRSAGRRPCVARILRLEPLEDRRLLAVAPWHNAARPLDVNGNGALTAIDAAGAISGLLQLGIRELPAPDLDPPAFYIDTDGDNWITPQDVLRVVNRLLIPPTATLSTQVPFNIDVTPIISVSATSAAGLPNGTQVKVDVDLNNDGDFSDQGEASQTVATLFNGAADVTLNALPVNGPSGPYTVRLRARVTDPDNRTATSPVKPLIIDTTMSDALDNYVYAPDPVSPYSWVGAQSGPGYSYYLLDMTSQTWRSGADVDKPVWRHWVEIIVPTVNVSSTALLFIDGGHNDMSSPPSFDEEFIALTQVAIATHSVVVRLHTVPSEPLVFTGESQGRTEDAIIAYSFDKYLEHIGDAGNETWPVLVAMTKSAVRTMDTVQTFLPANAGVFINDFVVTGYSKRGWTTWLTAAADGRVRAIIPGVFDNLNQGPQMVHHFQAYGSFSPAVEDYTNMQIFERILTPEAQQLSKIVDPYRYLRNGHFEIPKLLLNSAGDEFFVSDSAQYYFHDLPGQNNYLRYFPNTGHGLDFGAVESTISFYDAILNNRPLPKFSWTVEPDGALRVQTVDAPTQVLLWQATNTNARDFRHAYNPGIIWESSPLADEGGGVYLGNPAMPDQGARAYFVELTYPSGVPGIPHKFTTEIHVKSTLELFEWTLGSGFPGASPLLSVTPSPSANFNPVAFALSMAATSQPAIFETHAMAQLPPPAAHDVTSAAAEASDHATPDIAAACDDVRDVELVDQSVQTDLVDFVFGSPLEEVLA